MAQAPSNAEAVTSLQSALQSLTIDFPPNSARVPFHDAPLLKRAAEMIKELPRGTAVELDGYTRGSGNSPGDKKLAQSRAETVYRALVNRGVSPGVLTVKGLGGASAAGAAPEGRSAAMEKHGSAGRRVEFRVIHPQSETDGAAGAGER